MLCLIHLFLFRSVLCVGVYSNAWQTEEVWGAFLCPCNGTS